ncbi:MAG: hypothetical protein H6730_22255 [Deltaproteobacteria bacterium]|nr:hypothetical protein [Deltaproteobacteria bacterium]
MDIWRWVNDETEALYRAGHHRLAGLIDALPGYVVDSEHARVDATVAEALALVRPLKKPWLEVFIRHWDLQSRVLQRAEPTRSLRDAVDLLDFANQDATRDCPQSVCAVQDLCVCYAQADGPSYVAERLAVTEETLARIGPTWPCFTCISSERADALMDAGRVEEALVFLGEQRRAMEAAGTLDASAFRDDRVEALIRLGRLDEAWDVNERAHSEAGGTSWLRRQQLDRARILALKGDAEAARGALPPVQEVLQTPEFYTAYAEALEGVVSGGARANDGVIDWELRRMTRRMESQGCLRYAFEIGERRVRLAAARGAARTATHALADLERLAARFEVPADAPERLAEARARVAAMPPAPAVALPEAPEAVLDDPATLDVEAESGALLLEAAVERWPEHGALQERWARYRAALGERAEALADLGAFVDAHPDDEGAVLALGHVMREDHTPAELDAWAEARAAATENRSVQAAAWFVVGLAWREAGDVPAARERLGRVVALAERAVRTRRILADLALEADDLQDALHWLDTALAEAESDLEGIHWERCVVATLLERWDLVRASAAALGMTLKGEEGPVDEAWHLVRLQLTTPDGSDLTLMGGRTGPVTAEVLETSPLGAPQYIFDRVVFDPAPIDEAPEDEEGHIHAYRVVRVVHRAQFQVFELDGRRPDDDAEQALREGLDAVGARLLRRSGDEYAIQGPDDEEPFPGAFYHLAVPPDVPPQDVLQIVVDAGWPAPVAFARLARAAGDEALAEAHDAVVEEYGL